MPYLHGICHNISLYLFSPRRLTSLDRSLLGSSTSRPRGQLKELLINVPFFNCVSRTLLTSTKASFFFSSSMFGSGLSRIFRWTRHMILSLPSTAQFEIVPIYYSRLISHGRASRGGGWCQDLVCWLLGIVHGENYEWYFCQLTSFGKAQYLFRERVGAYTHNTAVKAVFFA